MINRRANTKRRVRYALLTNIELLVDASGLVTNTNNTYGQVDGSNNIVSLKSIIPTGRDFSVIGSGVTFDPTTKSIVFNGSGRLRSTGAASVFDFLSYNALGLGSIIWTAFIVCKIGNVIKPSNVTYGLLGNNGASSLNKGANIFYNNTAASEDTIQSFVTKGSAAAYLARILSAGSGPSNQYCVITVRMDGNEASTLRMRLYLNDQALLNIEQLHNNTVPVTTPTYALELGGVGNGVVPMVGNIKEIILTSSREPYNVVIAMARQLMNKHGIVRSRAADYLNTSYVPEIFARSDGSVGLTYHLSGVISQDPVNRNRVFSAYTEGGSHVYSANKKLVGRTSLVKAYASDNSFGAQFDIYNPAGADAVQDCGGGFDNNGVMHLFADVINAGGAGGCIGARHIYSSDLVSWTNTDITSSLAADGLAAWRMYGNLIHVGGVWIKPYYKATDHGDITNSANYIFRSTDGINWTSVTVRAPASAYINEPTVFWAGGNNIGYISRNEVTGEWSISMSSDLGLTWSAFQNLPLGETVTSPNPAIAKSFMHNGVLVNSVYITNRDNDNAFVVYGKASDIVANPVTGWNLNTKLMWFKTGLAPFHYHYGDVAHLDDTIKAVGLYTYDQWFGGGDGTVSAMYYITMPTWHIAKVESELGI